jgi:hypothetical protein
MYSYQILGSGCFQNTFATTSNNKYINPINPIYLKQFTYMQQEPASNPVFIDEPDSEYPEDIKFDKDNQTPPDKKLITPIDERGESKSCNSCSTQQVGMSNNSRILEDIMNHLVYIENNLSGKCYKCIEDRLDKVEMRIQKLPNANKKMFDLLSEIKKIKATKQKLTPQQCSEFIKKLKNIRNDMGY